MVLLVFCDAVHVFRGELPPYRRLAFFFIID